MTDRGVFNLTITVKSVQTEDPKKLELEVWRIRRMVDLMLETADEEAVFLFGGVGTSMERVE